VGPLPIDIVGVAPDTEGGSWALGSGPTSSSVAGGSIRVTAAGLLRDPNTVSLEPSATRPFERVQVQPGDQTFMVFAARSGRCALGRSNLNDAEQVNESLQQVGIVYEVLGVRAISIVHTPVLIVVPQQIACDPAG
jgi:hypothetical protein